MKHRDPSVLIARCTGKERFDTYSLASIAAKRKRGREVYHCDDCRGFHIGHRPSLPRRPRPPEE